MNRLFTTLFLAFALLQSATAGYVGEKEKLLRDDASGEWLIGFFPDFAVYDNKLWQCAAQGSGNMTLHRNGETLNVSLGEGHVTINGKTHKCSELTGRSVPYYPEADPTPFTDKIPKRLDSVMVRIIMPKGSKQGSAQLSYSKFFVMRNQINISPDSTGMAEITLPAPCIMELEVLLNNGRKHGRTFIHLYPEPGDTVTAFLDPAHRRYFVMGSNARLSNELLRAPNPKKVYVSYGESQQLTPTEYISKAGTMLAESLAQTDSIAQSHPTLSTKWATLQRGKAKSSFAYGLTQNLYNQPKTEIFGLAKDTLMRGSYFNPTIPYMADDNMLCLFSDFIGLTGYAGQGSTSLLLRKVASEMERQGQHVLTNEEWKLVDKAVEIDSIAASMPALEAQRYYEDHKDIMKAIGALYYRPAINTKIHTEIARNNLRIIDGMGLGRLTKDMALTWFFASDLENMGEQLTPELTEMAKRNITTPALRDYIFASNKKFADYAKAVSTPNAHPADTAKLASLTDGKEILDCITAPYRGRMIYVDVWGTWCVPCKEEMKHVPEMKKALNGMDVVFLYLCSRSSDESWRANIARFGLNGKDCVHYNLPQAQQDAVEGVLGVSGYPTYRIIDRQGRIVPGTPPRPSDSAGLKEVLKKIANKQ